MATIVAAAGGGNWNATATWVGSVVPTAADNVQLDATSGNVTINADVYCRSLDCTGYTGTLLHKISCDLNIGDATAGTGNKALTFSSGMTYTVEYFNSSCVFVSTSGTQQTINFASKQFGKIDINGLGSSYVLAGDLSPRLSQSDFALYAGTLSANTFAIQADTVLVNGASATLNLGSATHEITGRDNAWQVLSGTVNGQTSTIKLTYPHASSVDVTFNGGGQTYNIVWFARLTGTSSSAPNIILGSNTFAELKDTATLAHSLLFGAGTTQTVATFTVSGASAAQRITINTDAGSTATYALTKTGGGIVSCDFLNIQHSVATPALTWYAGTGSVDNQSVVTAGSGWIFTAPPPNSGAAFLFLMV
jgi:hypothetical protein